VLNECLSARLSTVRVVFGFTNALLCIPVSAVFLVFVVVNHTMSYVIRQSSEIRAVEKLLIPGNYAVITEHE
jgi:hypothetical protein